MNPGDALEHSIKEAALAAGVDLVGFGNTEGLAELPRVVAIAMRHSPEVLREPEYMPNREYSQEYLSLNERLAAAAKHIGEILLDRGFAVIVNAPTKDRVRATDLTSPFPHKTAATRAGLGWIGKSALLVTPQFGPALRLCSILTDAPLAVGEPINESRCGDCTVCVELCPAGAISGRNWHAGMPRQEFFDALECHAMCATRLKARGLSSGGCGVCMAVCPKRPDRN